VGKLFYVGLEPYKSRYTLQLTEWNTREFMRLGINFQIVPGKLIDHTGTINTGQVLDTYGRPYFALSQMMKIIELAKAGAFTWDDVIFFEDMFHPGIETLGYIFNDVFDRQRPAIAARCLAQTIDPDDFVHRTGMAPWMRKYEEMSLHFLDDLIFASDEMTAFFAASGMWDTFNGNVHVTGLPFGKSEVIERVGGKITPWAERANRVVFTSRLDSEKQPHFFLDIVEQFTDGDAVEFAIVSGAKLKSNDAGVLIRIRQLEMAGKLKVYENLEKNQYYDLLNNSKVLVNTALQDWVSNTVSEADALGCNVVFPAYRSFPEAFANDHTRLYIPWSLEDATQKLVNNLAAPSPNMGKISDYQDKTIERTVNTILLNRLGDNIENRDSATHRFGIYNKKY
jgi:hypothetical protein